MIGELFEVHVSVPELMLRGTLVYCAILVLTIVAWNWALDMLSFRIPAVRRFATPSRLTLVRRGLLQRHNMRREFITLEELQQKLREQGIERISRVKAAYLEGDGQISVIRNDGEEGKRAESAVPGAR